MTDFAGGPGERGLVSVIIPTRDRCRLIGEAIESVLAQTYSKWEIVVVDDGSTDGTLDLLDEYAARLGDERIRIFRQGRIGAQAARNLGTRVCRGEFVQYLDSDDLLSPDKLSAHLKAIESTGRSASFGGLRMLRDGRQSDLSDIPGDFEHRPVSSELRGGHLSPMLMLVRRSALRQAGPWDEGLEVLQDVDYAFRLWLSGAKAARCGDGAYVWRMHGGSRVGDAMFDRRRLLAWDRVLSNVESSLARRGRLGRFKEALACRYYLSALTPTYDLPELRMAWLRRAAELGRPSRPLAGPPVFCFLWLTTTAPAASGVYHQLIAMKRLLRARLKG